MFPNISLVLTVGYLWYVYKDIYMGWKIHRALRLICMYKIIDFSTELCKNDVFKIAFSYPKLKNLRESCRVTTLPSIYDIYTHYISTIKRMIYALLCLVPWTGTSHAYSILYLSEPNEVTYMGPCYWSYSANPLPPMIINTNFLPTPPRLRSTQKEGQTRTNIRLWRNGAPRRDSHSLFWYRNYFLCFFIVYMLN